MISMSQTSAENWHLVGYEKVNFDHKTISLAVPMPERDVGYIFYNVQRIKCFPPYLMACYLENSRDSLQSSKMELKSKC